MRLVEHESGDLFLARAGVFLEAAEAEHNLFFGIVHSLRTTPRLYRHGAWLATIEEGGDVVGASLQTPPQALLVTRMPPGAAELVARARPDATGAVGPREVGEAIAAALGRPSEVHRHQRIYACDAIAPVSASPGGYRRATAADGIVLAWRRAFADEIHEPGSVDDSVERCRVALESGSFCLWEDGGPVAMAAVQGPTPNGIRVSFVYTPPDRRNRGYATALVAALTAEELRSRRFCFLFTDLANPTSNAIYQRIGYRPVRDVTHLLFGDPA